MRVPQQKAPARQNNAEGAFFNKDQGFFQKGQQSQQENTFFSHDTSSSGLVQTKRSGAPGKKKKKKIQQKPIFESKTEQAGDLVQRKCSACEKEEHKGKK